MSKKEQVKNYNKFYHNDIKKQLGIDESRTASEKLLDKVIKVDKRADFHSNEQQGVQNEGKPQKKLKLDTQNETPQTNKQILQNKLIKNIENQQNLSKLLKSISIFKKCLTQESFLNDPQINFDSTWNLYSNKLINEITERNYSSVQSFNIMTNIADCLQILFKKFGNLKSNILSNEESQVNETSNEMIMSTKAQVFIWFCRLFTDDSFIFNKNLAHLKKYIFSRFNSQSEQKNEEQKNITLSIVQKLSTMPIKYDWAFTSLVNLLKDFNNQGYQNEFPSQNDKKTYLKSFNDLLNRKPKSSGTTISFNILGSSKDSGGLKTLHIETSLQNGSDKWVDKQ